MKPELKENAHSWFDNKNDANRSHYFYTLKKNIKSLEQLCAWLQIYESIESVQNL